MKLCQCRSCGKEFDEPLPTMISCGKESKLMDLSELWFKDCECYVEDEENED
jgi:hypothetical protein